MPVMDGIESARQMRMIENELQIRPAHIVALTGHSSHGEMVSAIPLLPKKSELKRIGFTERSVAW
jgi:CheY-like chemotaxis protein